MACRHGLVALLLLLAACGKGGEPAKQKTRPPAPVVVAAAQVRTVPVTIEAVGNVEALAQVAVKTMVNGEVVKVHFRDGQDVSKGQILFTLDPRQYEAALRKAEADLLRIKAQLSTARTNADRYGRLVKDGVVTAEQYDSFRTLAESLEADLAAQQAGIEALKVQFSYCTIRSPLSGRAGNVLITAGNVVKANDTISLVTINQVRPIYVIFAIPERELARVRQFLARGALRVAALPPGDAASPETGSVTSFDNTVDPATATIKLKATFANSRTRLWPGQFVKVRLNLADQADAVVVPTQAVQTGQQGQYVIVVKGEDAEFRPVKAGTTGDGVTVIDQGLKSGETVVIDGHLRVVPGGKVAVKQGGGKPDKAAAPAQAAASGK